MLASAALAVGLALVAITGAPAPAHASGSTQLLQDSFTRSALTSTQYEVGGTGGNTACLTTPGAPSNQVPGSCAGAADASGSGALRLTSALGSQTGYLLYNHALPTKAGLDIDFDSYQWGGNGADGITFFLSDGAYDLSSVGASGGSLGYSNSLAGSGTSGNVHQQGVPHGLIGVALDTYGNYAAESNNQSCGTDPTWTLRTPNEIAVRGAGALGSDGKWDDGYCLLAKPVVVNGGLDVQSATSRTSSARHVRIVVDPPSDTNPQIRVYLGNAGDTTTPADQLPFLTTVNEPAALQSASTFKFGWAASTGGSTDYHEINTLDVATVNPITPSLAVTTSNPAATDAGSTATATFATSTLSTDGPIAAGTPVTMTITKDPGLTLGALGSQSGWTLQSSSGDTAVYSYTPSAMVVSGTALPSLSIPVSASAAGSYALTAVASGGGIDTTENPASARTATARVTVRPTASPVPADADATTAPASASPTAITFQVPAASGVGSATPSYGLTSMPAASVGTAAIDASNGAVTFTPAAHWSGTSTFDYVVTAGGVTSVPASITVTTPPAASDQSATIGYGATATVDLSAGADGTGLSYSLVGAPAAGAGTASVSGSTLSFTPAAGFSGTATATYHATDASHVVSATKTVTITVQPEAGTDALTVSLDAHGAASVSSTLPSPKGTAPFSYALATGTSSGVFTVGADGTDGYTAASGGSGVFTATYTVTDANGVTSEPSTVTVTVKPYAAPLAAETIAGTAVTTAAPDTAGASGGVFAVTQPASGGTATIDAATGEITFTPTAGTSGNVSLAYTVTANGVTSDPATVSIAVAPEIEDHTATTPYGQAVTVDLGADAAGTGIGYQIVAAAGSAGTATLDGASGALVFTPADGFSGDVVIGYEAIDHVGLITTRAVTIHVLPAAGSATAAVSLPPTGDGPSTITLPKPSGTGPFHYALVPGSTSTGGTFAVDPKTGVVTFTPTPGVSGIVTAQYTVTDAAGNTSPAQGMSITVKPFTATPTVMVTVGATSDALAVPATVGTGPFVYRLVAGPIGPDGTATIDAATGVITFVPKDPNASGAVRFSYTTTDGGGIVSEPATATLDIKPVVADVAATVQGTAPDAVAGPAALKLAPSTVGTGPFTFVMMGKAVASGTPAASNASASSAPAGSLAPATFVASVAPAAAQASGAGFTVKASDTGFTVTPEAGFSGKVTFSYRVVGADDIASDPATATVTVLPAAATSGLAHTGTRVSVLEVGAALALLALGAFLVLAQRRRRGRRA